MTVVACFVAFLLNLVLFLGMVTMGPQAMLAGQSVLLGGPSRALAAVAPDECDDGDDNGDCDDDDPDNEWEGRLIGYPPPPQLHGVWKLAIRGAKNITVTATADTHFRPEDPAAYARGQWVEVQGVRQPDGSVLATHIRIDNYEVGEIVVRLSSAEHYDRIVGKYGLKEVATLLEMGNVHLFATNADDEQKLVQKIAEERGVIWAEVNFANSVPEDDGYKTWGWGGISEPDEYLNQQAFEQIQWEWASRAYQGEGVVVAVLDTGVYTPHEQFEGKLLLPSLDVISDDDDASEEGPGLAWGHGTHVAGVIAAMAPAAKILPVRVLDENGRGNTFLLSYAIEWASQQPGVQVINLSLGTEFDSEILRDVIAETVAQGIVVVAAVGNRGTNEIQYPAGYPDVIGVTALDHASQKAPFANYGEEWVDIAAPGVGIMSTMINEEGAGYATWSGTSMSTAFVSGAVTLLAGKMQVQAFSTGEVAGQLMATGIDLDALNPDYAGQIGRLLDVSAALDVEAMLLFIPQAIR